MVQEHAPLRQEDQFRELFGVLRRRKTIVILVTLFFALLGTGLALLAPASYQAVSRVLLRDYQNSANGQSIDPVVQISQVGVPLDISAQIGLMSSPAVLNAAFQQANVPPPNLADATEPPVTIDQDLSGPVLNIRVNLPNADDATHVAEAIPDAYIALLSQERTSNNDTQLGIQRTRLASAKADRDKADRALNTAMSSQGQDLVAASGEEGAQRTQRLNGYEQQLDNAKVSLASAQTSLQESIGARDKIPSLVDDTSQHPAIERLQAERRTVADLEGQLRSLLVVETEGSPNVRALRAKLNKEYAYQKTLPKIDVVTPRIRNPERLSYDTRVRDGQIGVLAAKEQVSKLQALVDKERAGLADFQKRLPEQRRLQYDLEQKQTAVASAAASLASLEVSAARQSPPLRRLATVPAFKTQPVVTRTIVSATLLGLVLGVLLALLRDRFDNRIYTLEQIYDVSGAVPIGAVPTSARALTSGAGGQARNRVLESYRSLRFNLESSGTGAAQSVLIASASAGEGRAGLSLNLATEAATDARKTILVDGNLRTPELHDLLKLQRGPGLSEVLSGAASLDDVLQKTPQENLLFLSAGADHPLPLELLTGASFAALHEALKERADVIVFNSPSLMRYTDGRAIAKVADSVLFVAKRGFTRRDAMRYCIGMLRRTQARLLGVVLSDESSRTSDVPYYASE